MSDGRYAGGVADILRRRAHDQGTIPALALDGSDGLTYAAVYERACRAAQALLGLGLRRGDRVAVALANDAAGDYLAVYFGCACAGLVFVPINPRAAGPEVARIVGHAQARLLIGTAPLLTQWAPSLASSPPRWTGDALAAALLAAPAVDPGVAVAGNDLAEIIYTSGTTGAGKGVAVPHGALTAVDEAPLLKRLSGKRFLHPLPLTTFAGATFMLFCMRAAMTNVLMSRFEPRRFADLLAGGNISSTYAVSSMWLLLLKDVPDLAARDFSALRSVQFGAAPMPKSAVLRLCELFPNAHVANLYGLTEAGGAGCMLPPGEARRRPDSVGRPLPNTEVRIVADDGTPFERGEVGEIWLRARDLPRRHYHEDAAATAQAWHDEGWLRTGDLGRVDGDGYVYLIDRKKDLIIRGGYNIASLEVEDALFQHPDVRAAAVIGVPHPELGEDVVACVVLQPGASGDAAKLREFLLAQLSDYKVPRRYEFLADLPRNATGKVLKRELRARHADPQASAAAAGAP